MNKTNKNRSEKGETPVDETKMKEKENTDNEEKTQENKETSSDGWGKIQRNAYQLTINNPAEHGLDHRTIKEILIIPL